MFQKCTFVVFMATAILFAVVKPSEEYFYGPFSNWLNVKTGYGAVGDGVSDDTPKLQAALNAIVAHTTTRVLYFPAGTYRITSTLSLGHKRHIAIVGEDPATTCIKWDGATDGNMVISMSIAYSHFGRITLDGSSKANRGWWNRWDGTDYFPTTFEFADLIFKDMKIGVQGGDYPATQQSTLAEATFMRCSFYRCSSTGIYYEDWNTVDGWTRFCRFEDCQYGIRLNPGQMSVYQSVFKRNTIDIYFQNYAYYSGIRGNFSSGSGAFFSGGNRTTIQNNVIDAKGTSSPIQISGNSPRSVLLDNSIRMPEQSTVAPVNISSAQSVLSMGNKFTKTSGITSSSTRRVIDDSVVAYGSVTISEPELPGPPPRFTGPVIEVSGFTGAAIQTAIIDAATNYQNQASLVRVKHGTYSITSPIVIPANLNVCVAGEAGYLGDVGNATRLNWSGSTASTVFSLRGPSKARIKDLYINGGSIDNVVTAEDCDQPGSRIFLDQLATHFVNTGTGIIMDGLDNTIVEAWQAQFMGNGSASVKGGTLSTAGETTTARLSIFGGSSGSQGPNPSFIVLNNGKIMVQDNWFETGSARTPMFNLTSANSGILIFMNGKHQYHTQAATGASTHTVQSFKGACAMIGMEFYDALVTIAGSEPQQNVLLLNDATYPNGGSTTSSDPGGNVVFTATAGTNVAMFGEYKTRLTPAPADVGTPTDEWLRQMLAYVRVNKASREISDLPSTVTDIRMWRIGLQGKNGLYAYVKNPDSRVKPSLHKTINPPGSFVRAIVPGFSSIIIPEHIRHVCFFNVGGRMIVRFSVLNDDQRRTVHEFLSNRISSTLLMAKFVP